MRSHRAAAALLVVAGIAAGFAPRAHLAGARRAPLRSVDPERDKEGLSDYARHFHPDFLGVTGDRAEIDKVVEATDGFYRFVGEGDAYDVQHTSAVSVIGPDGKLYAKLQPPLNAGPIAEFLTRLQIEYRREHGS